MKKILVIGGSGRGDAIIDALYRSPQEKELYIFSNTFNPRIKNCRTDFLKGNFNEIKLIKHWASNIKPDFAIIGPEEPLALGLADELQSINIPSIGPTQILAQIESSKSFTRDLLEKYCIPGNPEYFIFHDFDSLIQHFPKLNEFVVKPDGLTGGKGVKVFGDHFKSFEEGIDYCRDLFEDGHPSVIIEEKLNGEEFSLHSFCDGKNVVHMPLVQDHKRAYFGDKGPNTGGMGSYSCSNHMLPFLSDDDVKLARSINESVVAALYSETGQEYKGILYGSYMITSSGLKIIEFNARFGDPESLNILSILKTDFIDVCSAIIDGTLDEINIEFENLSTVCKYIVPNNYPDNPIKNAEIDLREVVKNVQTYYAGVDLKNNRLELTGSRGVAFVGKHEHLFEAEWAVEDACNAIIGPVFHRSDIGTKELIQKKIFHMKNS